MSYHYYEQLIGADKSRYDDKLKEIGMTCCPYKVKADTWVSNPLKWPHVDFGQLYTYLIESPSKSFLY